MLGAAIDGFIKPKTSRWFNMRADDDAINDADEAKVWFRNTEDRMYSAIYNPKARFQQRSGEVDLDLAVFGTGGLMIDEARNLNRLRFTSLHLKNFCILEDADGAVNTTYIDWKYTAEQAKGRFGEGKIGAKAKEALAEDNPDKPFTYLQVIQPSEGGGRRKFESCWYEVESKEQVGEGGYFEFPAIFPRWDTSSGEVYGRSQGMIALPDAQTGNAMGKTLLVAGQKAVDPPLWIANDSLAGQAPLTFPGGVNYFDMADLAEIGGRAQPFYAMDTGAKIPLGREMQNDNRELIWAAFLRNVLRLPIDGPQMTATEIIERKEEFIRTIGPFLGRLESDYTGPMIERVFFIMLRAGAFLPIPEVLAGRNVTFQFASPIERARKQIEAAAALRTIEQLGPMIEVKPDILDNFDFDIISRDMMETNGAPTDWMMPKQAVEALRQARQQQQQAAMISELANQGADTAQMAAGIPGVPEMLGLPAPRQAA
jgi:hypothetical protein